MKRILLKLSGEALAGDKKTGFDEATVIGVAKQVKELVDDGMEVNGLAVDVRTVGDGAVSPGPNPGPSLP